MSFKKSLLMSAITLGLSLSALSASKLQAQEAEERNIALKGGAYQEFPIARPKEGPIHTKLGLIDITLKLDPWFVQNAPRLTGINFADSTIDFSEFQQNLGQGCPALTSLNFKGLEGTTLKDFVEMVASPELLDRIYEGSCKVKFTCPDDGKTAARFMADQDGGLFSDDAIRQLIKMFKDQQKSAKPKEASKQAAPESSGNFFTGWLSYLTGSTAAEDKKASSSTNPEESPKDKKDGASEGAAELPK